MTPAHGMWGDGWFFPALFGVLMGLVGYIIGWLAGGRGAENGNIERRWDWSGLFPGLLLVGLGLFFLIDRNWYPLDLGDIIRKFWPLILVIFGLGMLVRRRRFHRPIGTPTQSWHVPGQKGETTP
ncbi:MAG: DUF5668 domain-containing protein [Candidatus Zixiibacteriota bacterium]